MTPEARTTLEGKGYRIGNDSMCSGCKASVTWVTTPAGRRMPVDPDGTSHFATCPLAGQFRRSKQ